MADNLDKVLNIVPMEVISPDGTSTIVSPTGAEDEDHTYARARHYELAEKGSEALGIAMKIVRETESPTAIKELSGLMKNLSEINKSLLTLNKDKAEVKTAKGAKGGSQGASTHVEQQNIIFSGSSKDLNKLINEQFKNHKE